MFGYSSDLNQGIKLVLSWFGALTSTRQRLGMARQTWDLEKK